MTLPKKKSRTITVDSVSYRWLVGIVNHRIHLTIEANDQNGQVLQAHFEPHDQFKMQSSGGWTFKKQGRSIRPRDVEKVIHHALANGWQPNEPLKPMFFNSWQTEGLIPHKLQNGPNLVALCDIASEQVSDLKFDLSTDPEWRKILFDSQPHITHPIPNSYFGISDESRNRNLHYHVFNDGYTDDGFIVFGIQSVEFPHIAAYTTNNPRII